MKDKDFPIEFCIFFNYGYINQYYDVHPEGDSACNISCVSMITGDGPIEIKKHINANWGSSQNEDYLIKYLKYKNFECNPITKLVLGPEYPRGRSPFSEELQSMREYLEKGYIIFYHKYGHYQLMIGYQQNDETNFDYIFLDPAGDRTLPAGQRSRESGDGVVYPESQLINEKIYGRCWIIKV